MAVDLSVAVGMEKDPIFRAVTAAMRSPHDMLGVPSSQRRDLLTAYGTDTVLRFPEIQQLSTASQVGFHLHTQSVFEVFLPVRVVRVGIRFQLGIALDRHLRCLEEVIALAFSLGIDDVSREDPVPVSHRTEILPLHQAWGLGGMSPFGPTPECFKDRRVDFVESPFAGAMPVILRPTPNDRIEAQDQVASGCLLVGLDDVSNFTQEGMHVFLSGLGQIRAAILPDMLSNFG